MSRDFELPELMYLVSALRWTLVLATVAFVGGFVTGFAVALLRVSRIGPLRWLAAGFIGVVQGTPLLMQLFLAFYGLAVLFGVRIDPWSAVALAFTLYASAFLGEIWRGAIQAVSVAQWEAASALALGRWHALRLIILPQALRIAIPPAVGFLIQLIKGTSVASIIGFVELTRAGHLIVNVTFQPMTVYPIIAALYFMVCWPLSLLAQRLERRLDSQLGAAGVP